MSATGSVSVTASQALIHPRWRVLSGALIVQLVLGTVYGYSIFWQPLQAEVGLSQSSLKYAFSICILSFALVMVIAGRVQDLLGPRTPSLIGAALMGGGFVIASVSDSPIVFQLAHAALVGVVALVLLMLTHALVGRVDRRAGMAQHAPLAVAAAVITAGVVTGQRYVGTLGDTDQLLVLWGTIGVLAGAGIGFAYVCPIAALIKWFPASKGLVAGVAVAGFGFGAYLFSHKSLPISAEVFIKAHGVRQLFLVHGLVCLVAIAVGALLLSNPPGAKAKSAQVGDGESAWQQTLRRPAFYVLWLMYFSGAMAGLMVIGILKPFAGAQLVEAASAGSVTLEPAQVDDLLARGVTAVGWLAIFNAVGRVVWGFLSDRVGRTVAFTAMFLFQAGVMFCLAAMKSELSLAVAASLVGFNYGGCFALFPSATADLFGAKNLGVNYGWLFTSYGIAGVIGIAAGNIAKERTGSYAAAFTFAAILCLLSAALAIGLQVTRKRSPA